MEGQDPVKNEESSGSYKRCPSSILKVPRKSIRFSESEQQDDVVEYTKPIEKRISRRVSFAPANDVLLFSKDVKSASPLQNPLQELITSSSVSAQNRVQMMVTEDGNEQMTGMETLLTAPMHALQQTASIHTRDNFGEKTLFNTDDPFMDMTHCHTIHITNEEERTSHTVPTGGDKTIMFIADDASMDMSLSQTVHLTCGQETFSLSKTTPTQVNQMTSGTDFTLSADVDKENQAPRQINKKIGGSLCVRPFSLEDDIDMTKAQTGSIATNTAEDDPPKCLFSQEIYHKDDKRNSQTKEKDWKSAIDPTQNAARRRLTVNFDPKDSGSSGKTIVFSEDIFMDKTQNHTVNIAMTPPAPSRQLWDTASLKERKSSNTLFPSSCLASGSKNILKNSVNLEVTSMVAGNAPSSKESDDPLQCLFQSQDMLVTQQKDTNYKGVETSLKTKMLRRQVNIDSQKDGREKTMRFSADDACMDVTRSYTVKISTDFQPPSDQNCLPASREKTARLTTNEAGMDMTECLAVNLSSSAVVQQQKSLHESLSVQDIDLEFEDFLASVSQGSVPNEEKQTTKVASSHTSLKTQSSVKTQGQTSTVLPMNNSRITRDHLETSNKGEMCPRDDNVNVDVSEVQTQAIIEDENLSFQNVCKTGTSSQQRRSELGSYTKKGIESSLMAAMQKHQVNFSAEDGSREKTVRFTAEGALMEVTRSHTANIAVNFEPEMQQNLDVLPVLGEKTVRFDIDSTMDEPSCHTANFTTDIRPPSHGNVVLLPKYGEKTVRFNANDATMDVTRSHTVNIDFEQQSCDNILPKYGEKTVRFNANDAEMDVTQSKTVNIASDFEPRSCAIDDKDDDDLLSEFGDKNLTLGASDACKHVTQSNPINIATNTELQSDGEIDTLPKSVEKTMRFDVKDARMEATQCLTGNIGVNSEGPHSDLNSVPFGINMTCPSAVKKLDHSVYNVPRSRSLAAHSLKPALKSRSAPWACSVITRTVTPTPASTEEDKNITPTLACAAGDINVDRSPIETHEAHVETEKSFVSAVTEKSEHEVLQSEDCQVNDLRTNMTEALTGDILGQTQTEDLPEYSVQDLPPSAEVRTTEAHEVELRNESNSSEINENKNTHCENNDVLEESKCSTSSLEQHSDPIHSRKSQKMTLDYIKSKMRRLSQMLNAAPENVAVESYTTPLIDPELNMGSLPAPEPDLKVDQGTIENQSEPEPLFTSATPFKLETKQLMSRLSVVSFKPKFRQQCKAEETKKLDSSLGQSSREPTRTLTIHIPNQFGNVDHDVSDINDEELGTCEDVSGTMDIKSLEEDSEQLSYFNEFGLDPELQNEMFEEECVPVNEKKRPSPDDEKLAENKKKMKTSSDAILLTDQECDDNITVPPTIHLQTTDSSNCSNTASLRCEATFESTSKQSMFESQLEDYASDLQRKFDDGSLTVMEFFKLFHIDFVIHNLRQSCVPARVLTDTNCTLLDLAKDRHISFPKQLVYEAHVHKLTEQVEGLKFRMCDLDKPLIIVNRTLWEEMRLFSEAMFKSFAAKLKERHNLFRKQSKAQSHQMKEVLYSNLLQANVEEQKKLRGTIEKADAMIKSLDDCIEELEADLAAVEEGMTSQQEELNKITETLADKEKSILELELQKKQNLKKLKRVKDETENLEDNIDILHLINEWKVGERTSNCAVYTFLYKTLHLELVYEESKGNDDDRKITEINFVQQLNNETSQCHARLVHALVTQYTQGQSWVKKYPTSKHAPQLLHDVSLVVSHCRRLGEELRQLKMWGGLRFDILDISCVDTEVHIVFSSLKRFSKFEVVFSVSLTSHLYVVQLKEFKNIIGNVTIQHIEEIVASFTPDNNYLTKIINKIHSSLFC